MPERLKCLGLNDPHLRVAFEDAAEQRGGNCLRTYRTVPPRNQRAQDMGEEQADLFAGSRLFALGVDQRWTHDRRAGEPEIDDALLGLSLGPQVETCLLYTSPSPRD